MQLSAAWDPARGGAQDHVVSETVCVGSNEGRPSPDDETYLNALDGIDAVEGIEATRFNLPAIGWGTFSPSMLEALIPPRRGPVQGFSRRAPP